MANTKRSPEEVVRSLLEKTITRGATPGEQDAAVAKARELVERHRLDATGFDWPPGQVEAPKATRSIRQICEELILRGVPTAEILAAVKAEIPSAKTTSGCVSWYRSKLVKRGLLAARRAGATTGTGATP